MIRDLLWACPECGTIDGIVPLKRGEEECQACGARFRRGAGATIEATLRDGTRVARAASEWAAKLPDPESAFVVADRAATATGLIREADVLVRFASGYRTVHRGREYLGRIERLGPRRPGKLRLYPRELELVGPDDERRAWPLERITAVQPSSSSLQIKVRNEPVVSFKFVNSSPRLWEELICAALRRLYRERGLGEIIEFQPRIVVR